MILVMGGAGYIGSHTVQELVSIGQSCIIADNFIYGHIKSLNLEDEKINFIEADLMDKKSLRTVFKNYKIDAVIHFAAYAYVGESVENPQKYYQNNLVGTLNLLDIMLEFNVKKIVFSSTCATYGEPQYTPIDEKHPQNPINSYGKTKLMIEQVFEDYHKAYGLKYIALRYFNAAGASLDANIGESHTPETHLIPLVLQTIKGERDCIKIFGTDYNTPDVTCLRDYIHVIDLAVAHRLALEKIDDYSGYLNLGTGISTSVKEIIKIAEEVTGLKCSVENAPRRAGDPAKLFADNKKACEVLNWTPKHSSLEEIIQTAWNWEQDKKY